MMERNKQINNNIEMPQTSKQIIDTTNWIKSGRKKLAGKFNSRSQEFHTNEQLIRLINAVFYL